jgi:hypothetical protein|tara:strand:- start:675 stop:5228 length:4554 start_codon:yes stop_codon:yes gene_type:complete
MAYERKNFNELRGLNFNSKDDKFSYKSDKIITNHGFEYQKYDMNLSARDLLTKNYTSNILTRFVNTNEILNFTKLNIKNTLNTKLTFGATQAISGEQVLTTATNKKDTDSVCVFDIDSINQFDNGQSFLIDLFDNDLCSISFNDGLARKYLFNYDDKDVIFKFLDNNELLNRNLSAKYFFQYNYDSNNNILKLYNNNKILTTGVRVISSTYRAFDEASSSFETIVTTKIKEAPVLSSINFKTSRNGLIKVDPAVSLTLPENLDQYIYYDFEDNYKVSDDSLSGINYNMINYYPYSNILLSAVDLSGSNNNFYVDLDFFNLKNHISNHNLIHGENKLDDPSKQRIYYSFSNNKNTEVAKENLSLNYTFFNKEYQILPNRMNKLIMPDDITPYKKININDTTLAKNGAFAAESPYFSDKVFKLTDKNRNNLQDEFTEVEDNLVANQEESFILLQNDDILGFQNINELQKNDIFGTYLCTWLKSNGNDEGTWFDRYYLPEDKSYVISLTGTNSSNSFDTVAQAKKYFESNTPGVYYADIKSNMTFEPNAEYLYQRIGKDYISNMVANQSGSLIKQNFEVALSGKQVVSTDTINFNDTKGFDNFKIIDLDRKNFHISFDLSLDSLSSFNSYNVIGNQYNDGFSLRNNFYYTPFIFIPFKNTISIFNNEFNKVNTITLPGVSDILDIIYIEQNNDIVVICSNKIVKTNVLGEIISEVSLEENDKFYADSNGLKEICAGTSGRYAYGAQNCLFFTNNYYGSNSQVLNLDLNSLTITDLNIPFRETSAYKSAVTHPVSGVVPLDGRSPVYVNDETAITLENSQRFISIQNIPGEAFVGTALQGTYVSGIPAGTSFTKEQYDPINAVRGDPTSPAGYDEFFVFKTERSNRIIFDVFQGGTELDPIIDTIDSEMDAIGGIDNRVYAMVFTDGVGKLDVTTDKRFKLSSFPIQTAAISAVGIDFIHEDGDWKALCFSQDITGNTLLDKINTNTGEIEKTIALNVSSFSPRETVIMKPQTKFEMTSAALGFRALSSVFVPYNENFLSAMPVPFSSYDIIKNQRILFNEFTQLVAGPVDEDGGSILTVDTFTGNTGRTPGFYLEQTGTTDSAVSPSPIVGTFKIHVSQAGEISAVDTFAGSFRNAVGDIITVPDNTIGGSGNFTFRVATTTTTNSKGNEIKNHVLAELTQANNSYLSANMLRSTFTGGTIVQHKYRNLQDKLTFQMKVNNNIGIRNDSINWDLAGPPFSATGFDDYEWNLNTGISPFSASVTKAITGWSGKFTNIVTGSAANFEINTPVPFVKPDNHFNLDFNLNNGLITLYNNGLMFGKYFLNPSLFPMQRILSPDVFINLPVVRNESLNNILSSVKFYSDKGTIRNLKVYDRSLNQDLVNYIVLNDTDMTVDNLYFDMYNNTRNNIEEIDTMFNYKIPGSKTNYGKIRIKNINVNDDNIESLIKYVHLKIQEKIPSSVLNLTYNVNKEDYHIMDNGRVMKGAVHEDETDYLNTIDISNIDVNNIIEQNNTTDSGGGY